MTLTMVKEEVIDLKPSILKLEHELILDDHEETGNADVSMGSKILRPTKNQRRRQDSNKSTNQKKAPQKKLGLFPIVILERLDLSSLKSLQLKIKTSASSDKSGPEKSLRIKEEPVDIADLHADFEMDTSRPVLIGASSHRPQKSCSTSAFNNVNRKLTKLLGMESGIKKPTSKVGNGMNKSVNENCLTSSEDQHESSISVAVSGKSSVRNGHSTRDNSESHLNNKPKFSAIDSSLTMYPRSKLKKGYVPCNLCEAQLKNEQNLRGHLRNVHSDERPFSCKVCPYTCKAKSALKSHELSHSDHRPFNCELCGATFKSKGCLRGHFSSGIHSSERPFACKLCTAQFSHKSNLVSHIKTHSKEILYSCKVCAKGFSRKRYLQSHLTSHSDERPFSCDYCFSRFKYKSDQQKHYREKHSNSILLGDCSKLSKTKKSSKVSSHHDLGRNKISCDICSAKFLKIGHLRNHLRTHSSEKIYTCEVCSAKYKDKKSLQIHLEGHANERLFGCALCPAKFNRRTVLLTHLKFHSDDKPFSCNVCGKRFKIKAHLTKHSETHSELRPFHCEKCNARFKSREYLKKHLKSHSVAKPFTCDQCSVRFKLKKSLNSHIETDHTEWAIMSCKYCSAEFTKKCLLKSHVLKMHTEERPFVCHECNFRAETRNILEHHLQIHSDERPFACKICSRRFKRRWILKSHVQYVHRQKPLFI